MFRSFFAAVLFMSATHAVTSCSEGQSEMSVEGIEGIYCVGSSMICIADVYDGACPDVQDGLPSGSYCGVVASGVYGCKVGARPTAVTAVADFFTEVPADSPANELPTDAPVDEPTDNTSTSEPTDASSGSNGEGPLVDSKCSDTQSEMSVENVDGVFCVDGWAVCMGEIWNGACPGVQDNLPNGSYCGRVASGVYGCKAGATIADTPTITSVTPALTAETPAPVVASPTLSTIGDCGVGSTPMSIEGVAPIFCVSEPACVADRSNGNCPGAQDGLPWGSYCDTVRTGIFGCKPYMGLDTPTDATYPSVLACEGEHGDTPVSVVEAGTFCAAQPVCSGTISGNCPRQQDGLSQNSTCVIISTGVYGCVMLT